MLRVRIFDKSVLIGGIIGVLVSDVEEISYHAGIFSCHGRKLIWLIVHPKEIYFWFSEGFALVEDFTVKFHDVKSLRGPGSSVMVMVSLSRLELSAKLMLLLFVDVDVVLVDALSPMS